MHLLEVAAGMHMGEVLSGPVLPMPPLHSMGKRNVLYIPAMRGQCTGENSISEVANRFSIATASHQWIHESLLTPRASNTRLTTTCEQQNRMYLATRRCAYTVLGRRYITAHLCPDCPPQSQSPPQSDDGAGASSAHTPPCMGGSRTCMYPGPAVSVC